MSRIFRIFKPDLLNSMNCVLWLPTFHLSIKAYNLSYYLSVTYKGDVTKIYTIAKVFAWSWLDNDIQEELIFLLMLQIADITIFFYDVTNTACQRHYT